MKVRMMFASAVLFLGAMLGSASAQNNVTCSASGSLNLTGSPTTIKCVGTGGAVLWQLTNYSSTQLVVEYLPTTDYAYPSSPKIRLLRFVSAMRVSAL